MRTIDTNILVRLLAQDDDRQWAIAADLVSRFQLLVMPTVLMETEWILRSRYRFDKARIFEMFEATLNSKSFVFTERERVLHALEAFSKGMDFADAMHVSFMEAGETFITFDRDLVRRAKRHIEYVSIELAS